MVPLKALGWVMCGGSVENTKVSLCKSSFGQTTLSVWGINTWISSPTQVKLNRVRLFLESQSWTNEQSAAPLYCGLCRPVHILLCRVVCVS